MRQNVLQSLFPEDKGGRFDLRNGSSCIRTDLLFAVLYLIVNLSIFQRSTLILNEKYDGKEDHMVPQKKL